MHCLHRILVYIPEVADDVKNTNKAELIDLIRSCAEERTEDYYEQVFDWRETDTAGRWEDMYPENVIFAKDNPEQFIKELTECLSLQKSEIESDFAQLKCTVGTDLEQIKEGLWNRKSYDDKQGKCTNMTAYYLRNISKLLYGEYTFDSGFYNSHEYTARLYQSDIEEISKNPNDWALVMFDYHY